MSTVTEKQFEEICTKLIQADFELMDARARLDAAKLPKAQAAAEKIRDLESAVEAARNRRSRYNRYVAQLRSSPGLGTSSRSRRRY